MKDKPEQISGIMLPDLSKGLLLNYVPEIDMKLDIPDFSTFLKSRWIYMQSVPTMDSDPNQIIHGSIFTSNFSPFYQNVAVFNQAAYRVSDKLVIGGSSFGARSLLSAPLPGNLSNTFDTRGASLFFQYKVNPKFRIETRISVTNHPAF